MISALQAPPPPAPCLASIVSQQRLQQPLQTCLSTWEESLLLPCRPQATIPADIPYHVIVAMLRRDILLTCAKLNAHSYERIMGERQLRKLNTELRQVRSPQSQTSWGRCQGSEEGAGWYSGLLWGVGLKHFTTYRRLFGYALEMYYQMLIAKLQQVGNGMCQSPQPCHGTVCRAAAIYAHALSGGTSPVTGLICGLKVTHLFAFADRQALSACSMQEMALSDLLKGTLNKVEGRRLAAEQELAASGVRATSKGSKAYLRVGPWCAVLCTCG